MEFSMSFVSHAMIYVLSGTSVYLVFSHTAPFMLLTSQVNSCIRLTHTHVKLIFNDYLTTRREIFLAIESILC